MVVEYASLRGTTNGMDLTAITEIADYFDREIGMDIPSRMPFVGRNFNATRAGIHADGLLKDEEIYNIFDTQKLLNRPPVVVVGPHSGAAGLAYWIMGYFKPINLVIDKKHALVAHMKEQIDSQFAAGRTTSMGDEEMEMMVKEYDEELYIKLTHHLHRK
jgi:isopropylmalate/homocitrate/citramalate synthase